ncbi:MAG: hypothetical protein DHS20C15_01600 [Planctomycetota bacterium]|nr:MAG: hypothetical protein DHS20C15_01600 [Planctomycetota bacterium]
MARSLGLPTGLLAVLLVALVVGLALLGATVGLPLGGWAVLGAFALVIFLGLQLLVFRSLGLKSAADQARREGDDAPADENDPEWRAWRG